MPRKAYLRFESRDNDDDFRFLLARTLRKFVHELDDMPHDEYMRWFVWLGREAQKEELAAKPRAGR
jgi:hypothetical protein